MDDSKKVRLETLIEKFISDIQEEYQQALMNKEDSGGMKTVSAMAPSSTISIDIDKKITNLENLIQRLQSEITNISLQSQKSNEGPLNLKALTDKKKDNEAEEKECSEVADCMPKNVNVITPSPIILTSTLSEPIKKASQKFDETISNLMNATKKYMVPSNNEVNNTINDILEGKKDDNNVAVAFKDGLEDLIEELKAEIAIKMEELKDVKDPYNNDDDD